MEKQNNIPKLRFPEFSDGWEVKKLGEVADISSGGTPNRAIPYYWNGNIPWVSTTLIDFNTITETNEFVTDAGLKNSSAKLFPIGTLLMAMYGQGKTRGKIAVLGIEASTNQACGAIMVNKSILDYLFVFQNLSKRYDEIRDLSNQGGQENLSGGIIKGIEISFPTIPEQQKIATFLSTVDEKLQALKNKKSLLETYKKGIMQKLFSQQIRFKDDDGNDFEDWEVKTLGEICSLITKGTTPSQFSKISTDVNFIKIESISVGGKIDISKTLKITDFCHKSLLRSQLRKGDILFSIAGTLGRVAVIEEKDLPANTNQALSIIRLIDSKQLNFLKYHLTTDYITKYIESCTTVGAQPNINLQQVNELLVNLPSLSEHTKVVNFLTAIDEKINKVDSQIKQMELWKKGLLQQMFV